MAHSNQIREFLLTDHGVELRDVYVGPEGVLTGSARLTKEAENEAALLIRNQEVELRRIELERKRTTLEAQIAMLRAEFAVQEVASLKIIGQETAEKAQLAQGREDMGVSRKVDAKPNKRKRGLEMKRSRHRTSSPHAAELGPLYSETVRGRTVAEIRSAIANIKKICEEELQGHYELEVIDLYQQPQLAQGDQIIAVPTLIKKLPPPLRRIIGDLSDTARVLVGLDIKKKA